MSFCLFINLIYKWFTASFSFKVKVEGIWFYCFLWTDLLFLILPGTYEYLLRHIFIYVYLVFNFDLAHIFMVMTVNYIDFLRSLNARIHYLSILGWRLMILKMFSSLRLSLWFVHYLGWHNSLSHFIHCVYFNTRRHNQIYFFLSNFIIII